MDLSIETSQPADASTWDQAWQDCPYATYFHSREWADLWNAYSAGSIRSTPAHLTFSDGATALLPLSCVKRSRFSPKRYLSSPMGTYGGWLGGDDLTMRHKALLVQHMASQHRDLEWRVNPYDNIDLPQGLRLRLQDETQVLPLIEGFPAIIKRATKGHRSAARKAQREGVTVSLADTRGSWLDFAAIYADSVRRWGDRASSIYEPRLLESMWERNSPNIKLWLAYYEGIPVAGALCLYAPRHAVYWLGAALEEYFPLRPVHLLVYRAVEDACRSDHEWFDFNPSGGHEGVVAFKKGFGTIRLPAPVVLSHGCRSRLVTRARLVLGRGGR